MGSAPPRHIVIASRAVAPQHGFGGLESAVAHHLRGLARRGVRVTVFTQPPTPGFPPPEDFGGLVTWRELPYRAAGLVARLPLRRNSIPDRLLRYGVFVRLLGREVAALARRERVDLVHAHGLTGAGYARELRAEGRGQRAEQPAGTTSGGAVTTAVPPTDRPSVLGLPPSALPSLVLNPHGLEEFKGRSGAKALAYTPFRWGMRAAAAGAAAVIATDRSMTGDVARLLRVPPERVATIPNGVDVARLDALVEPGRVAALRDRFGLAAAPLTLATVARLERNKGLREAVLALDRLRDHLPAGWRWLIVGGGSEEGALRDLIGRRGLGANITLAGALDDVDLHNLLETADLLLVPSLYEGSSLAALEGMVHRLPVVATTVGGLPDKARPGETGFLAAPGDPEAFAAALATALAARVEWPAYGARARALVAAEFDWAVLTDRYLALYEGILARRALMPG